MKTKLIALSLSALLLLPLAAGCAGGNKKQTVNLVIYTQLANFAGTQIGWAAEVLKEKFNVTVTIIKEDDGTFATSMESGNLGDIVIFGNDVGDYQEAAEAGMLLDWEKDDLLAEYGPAISEHFRIPLEKNRGINPDGKIYGFGHNVGSSSDDHDAFFYYPHIRWDLYEKLGKPEIKTLEDFIPVLEQMVALEPTSDTGGKTYAVSSFPDWDGDMVMMVKSTGALYGYDEFGVGLYDTKTQTWEDCLSKGGMYLRALKFYNTLFQKGLYDPDSMTQTFDDMSEKYRNGVCMFNIFEWMAGVFNTPEHKAAGKLMACVAAEDQKNIVYGLNPFGGNRVWTIGAKTNYPELCMEIINWFCTQEGVLTYNYGPKGVTWDIDSEGEAYMTDLGLAAQEDKRATSVAYGDYSGSYQDGEFQHNNTTWSIDSVNPESPSGQPFRYSRWVTTILKQGNTEIERSWRAWAGAATADEYLEKNGHLSISIGSTYTGRNKGRALTTTWTQVTNAIKDGSWSAIYAPSDAEFDAIVAKMVADAKAYGYDECVAWQLEEVERRKAAEDTVTSAR
ncbi:MAG: extracellular solute-binding protein [Oscillospiraceae bacterium]|jgi:multiple sugar transport system substrate-binding protein/putative aldouronate transport system substrate-binding protein|nr:extracellular solute-binding protein [Oscillospiraceae bacterium]